MHIRILRFHLLAALAMAYSASVLAQQAPVISGPKLRPALPRAAAGPQPYNLGGEGYGGIAPVDPAGVSATPGAAGATGPAVSVGADPAAVPPTETEPRTIRGNDRVIAAPRAVPRLAGAAASFKFEDAPIGDVVNVVLGEILKVDFVLHGQVTGNVTLATRAPVPPDQAMFLLETALQTNGLVIARDTRGVYHVGKPDALKGIVPVARQATGATLPPGYGAIIVPLQYIGAAEMATILRPMMAADSLVRVDPVRNLLILSGTRTQAEGWLDMVATFDVDLLKGMTVGMFPLKYAAVADVEAALRLMSGATGAPAPAPTAPAAGRPGGQPQAQAQAGAAVGEGSVFGALRILPIPRLNSILVVTPRAAYLDEVRRWIDKLDRPSDNAAEPTLHIYPVQNGNARHLAEVIGSLFGGAGDGARTTANSGVAPGLGSANASSSFGSNAGFGSGGAFGSSGGGGGFGGMGSGLGLQGQGLRSGIQGNQSQQGGQGQPGVTGMNLGQGGMRVVADEVNNAILVYGPRSEFVKIEATLKRLDVRAPQVLIEANIIEVTLGDDLEYGLAWAFKGAPGGFNGRGGLDTLAGGALTAAGGAGFSYTLRAGTDVRAALSLLASKSRVKVISSPSLMVMDNGTASITVGDQIPIQSGETVTTIGTTSIIQYKDTGVQLQVTPTVNAGNLVTMQLNQAVTDVGPNGVNGQPTFLQRQIQSKVSVRSGEALVMGGLIRDNARSSREGIPFLQDIPGIGAAFSSTSNNAVRTELLLIITPRVMRSDEDAREIGAALRESMKGLTAIDGPLSGTAPVLPPSSVVVDPSQPGLPALNPGGSSQP